MFLFNGYDLTLPVVARRTLLCEDHNNQERRELVWMPTQDFLEKLAEDSPDEITFFIGDAYQYPEESSDARCANLYAVNRKKETAYIGTVFNHQAIIDDRDIELRRLEDLSPKRAKQFAERGLEVIVRDRFYCIIPALSMEFDQEVLNGSVQRYLATFIPKLKDAAIKWLPAKEGALLDCQVWQEAKRTAVKLPAREWLRKVEEDEIIPDDGIFCESEDEDR